MKYFYEKTKIVQLKLVVMIFVISSLAACVARPTQQQIESADYGTYPQDYEDIIKTYMGNVLFDPYSAIYSNWSGPSKGYSGDRFTQVAYGYRVCVDINAKNRMGGYVGVQKHYFLIHNRQIIQRYDEILAKELCNL